jgi:predicted nicotinamide N-methyase
VWRVPKPGGRGSIPEDAPKRENLRNAAAMDAELIDEPVAIAGLELRVLRPPDAEALIDEAAFETEEFLPYWAELWPAGLALAEALPARLRGLRVVELGCGLALPSLVAAARGAAVLATDWAPAAVELVRTNADRNGLTLEARVARWDEPTSFGGGWDLVLAADVLYEPRNVPQLHALLPRLGAEVLLAEPGRPAAKTFFREAEPLWRVEEVAERVYRLSQNRANASGSWT